MALSQKISTGCESIDKDLDGGVSTESVALIYGEAETGKTTLTLQCAVNCARQGYKTLFVDCDGTFSGRRLAQMASQKFEEIAELIILVKPENFGQQTHTIDKLPDYITKNHRLLIIDTITSLYRIKIAETPEKSFALNRELNRQMATLSQIARLSKIAVLVTSQVRSVLNDNFASVEPVATRVLKFWADTIISMKPTENLQVIKAVLEKSPKKFSSPPTHYLKIENTGIHEYNVR